MTDDSLAMARHLRARLRFKHLDMLVKLESSTSLHQASASLSMTQSAVTKLLQEVEQMVGAQLFERSRSGITPTASGKALIARAHLLLNMLQTAHEEISAIELGASGYVRLGMSANAASTILPRALALLQADSPGVVVAAHERGPEMLDELRRGDFDCVVGRLPAHSDGPDLIWEHLYDEPVSLIVRKSHPLTKMKNKLSWADALAHDWILPHEDGAIQKALYMWFAHSQLHPPQSRFRSISIQANIAVVQDSDNVALLPAGVAQRYAEQKLLHILPLKLPVKLPSIALIMRRDEEQAPAAQALICALKTASVAEREKVKHSPLRKAVVKR